MLCIDNNFIFLEESKIVIDNPLPGESGFRNIQIDTERVRNRQQQHYGVIDIGSNSIRLLIYDDLSRAPFPRFNEKSLVALASSLDESGNFTIEAIKKVRHVMVRFAEIIKAMEVTRVDVLATEATRKAHNSEELVKVILQETGLKARILTGEQEANYTALGVISGFYQPRGLVGDFGGGSLEVAEIIGDRVGERKASMPLGALPVKDMLANGVTAAKRKIDDILDENLPPLLTEPVFYAVGGGWRALARIDIAMNNVPVKVAHGYEVPAKRFSSLAKTISKMDSERIAALPDVPSRRVETLAASALVLWRVLRKLKPDSLIFSAFGLREGWLYSQLDEEEQFRDPLLEGAQALGLSTERVAGFSEALGLWTESMFPGESQADRRLRLSICALTDIGWRDHQKIRGEQSFERLLQFPFIGISHRERAYIAIAILARYAGKVDSKIRAGISGLLTPYEMQKAEILGRTLLLGHRFSASVAEILDHSRLHIDQNAVRLEILNPDSAPDSEAVLSRLRQLAKAIGVSGSEIVRSTDE